MKMVVLFKGFVTDNMWLFHAISTYRDLFTVSRKLIRTIVKVNSLDASDKPWHVGAVLSTHITLITHLMINKLAIFKLK